MFSVRVNNYKKEIAYTFLVLIDSKHVDYQLIIKINLSN